MLLISVIQPLTIILPTVDVQKCPVHFSLIHDLISFAVCCGFSLAIFNTSLLVLASESNLGDDVSPAPSISLTRGKAPPIPAGNEAICGLDASIVFISGFTTMRKTRAATIKATAYLMN